MLDPRTLTDRRDEIVESCRKRRVQADVDGAIAAHEEVSRLTTELGALNQTRNEHQKAGKGKMEPDAREAHVAEGRRLKDEIGEIESRLRDARDALQEKLDPIPNFIHPESPEGDEEDYRVISHWSEPAKPDFEPQDHLAICENLDLVDFERAREVAGQKWY